MKNIKLIDIVPGIFLAIMSGLAGISLYSLTQGQYLDSVVSIFNSVSFWFCFKIEVFAQSIGRSIFLKK